MNLLQLPLVLRSSVLAQPLIVGSLLLLMQALALPSGSFLDSDTAVFSIILVADAVCHQKLLPGSQPCPCSSCRAMSTQPGII